jgi:hypothetical protein
MEEDICQNQTLFKFLVYLENSIFRSISKKVYENPPNLPYWFTVEKNEKVPMKARKLKFWLPLSFGST